MTDETETLRRLRRLALRIHLGPKAGLSPKLRSLLRYLSNRGSQSGQRSAGRLRDYLFVLSAIKDRNLYRRREIAPLRRIHVVLDVRDFHEGVDARWLRAAELICGILLAMPSSRFSMGAWGTRDLFPMRFFDGIHQWQWLRQILARFEDLPIEQKASTGALLRAAATDEAAHLVIVTSWIEPSHIRGLPAAFGGTCFLVEPSRSFLRFFAVGDDPALTVLPPDAACDRDADRLAALSKACDERRLDLLHLQSKGDMLEQLERLLAGQ